MESEWSGNGNDQVSTENAWKIYQEAGYCGHSTRLLGKQLEDNTRDCEANLTTVVMQMIWRIVEVHAALYKCCL